MALVQKAMGFKYCAKIEFDRMDLSNEDSEKALLIQLADRNLISDEMLQNRFGFDPDMEKNRLNRESRDRNGNRMVRKSGPWFDPQIENSLKKIALQGGGVAPSQVGLNLEKKKGGEKSAMEMKIQSMPSNSPTQLAKDSPESLPGVPGQGRPKTSKDSGPRKTKVFKPQTGASLIIWANDAQDKINDIINPILLDFYKKKNLRSLSAEESKELEELKTKILFSTQAFSRVDQETIMKIFSSIDKEDQKSVFVGYNNWSKELSAKLNKTLTVEEQKQAKASFYSYLYTE